MSYQTEHLRTRKTLRATYLKSARYEGARTEFRRGPTVALATPIYISLSAAGV
jgi:hypothetical protein